jgi:DoxX-like family
MKNRRTAYWIATGFVACIMTVSGVLAIIRAPYMMQGLAHLGYPVYFSDLLGVGKLAGVCVLLAPGMARLKEWAYVAFGITVLSATYSHFSSGDGLMALEPLVTFAALVVSYRMRPAGKVHLFGSSQSTLSAACNPTTSGR